MDHTESKKMEEPVLPKRDRKCCDGEPWMPERVRRWMHACVRQAKEHPILMAMVLALSAALAVLGALATAFQPLGWKAWFSIAIVILLLCGLSLSVLPTHVLFAFALGVLVVFQCVESANAVSGFSNLGVQTVAVLFIAASAITRTNALSLVFRKFVGYESKNLPLLLLKVNIPLGLVSMFFLNIPIFAMALPVLLRYSAMTGIVPSKMLMPVSICLSLAGTLSIIGSTINLIVAGLAESEGLTDEDGNVLNFSMFGITKVGVIYFGASLVYTSVLAPFNLMLPERRGVEDTVSGNIRKYLVYIKVSPKAKSIVGKSILSAGLQNFQDLQLIEIHRGENTLPTPSLDMILLVNDVLVFSGRTENVKELIQKDGGLLPLDSSYEPLDRLRSNLYEAVVSRESLSLIGRKIAHVSFRDRFDAAVIAVTDRSGSMRSGTTLGDLVLQPGDALILEGDASFYKKHANDRNFSLVYQIAGSAPPMDDWFHIVISIGILAAMVLLPVFDVVDVWVSGIGAAILLILTGCITLADAEDAIDFQLLLTIALSFGVAGALDEQDVGDAIANFLVGWLKPLGPIGILFAIYVTVSVLSEMITSNGAVVIVFPVVAGILKENRIENLSPYAALYVMMLSGTAAFLSPVGYQLNLMAHSIGGYHYSDWFRFAAPLQFGLTIIGVVCCYNFY